MSISFQNIPSDWRVPLYWVELDNSQAGFPYTRMPALMVGTMTTKNTDTKWNGTATPDVPILIGRQQDANSLFGQGSELAQMFEAFFANNLTQQIYGLPVAESAASVQASGTITVNSVPTQAGTLHLYIAGVDVPVNIPADATITVNEIASNIADAINANPDLPVTATSAAAVCTVACKWGGINGNEITIADSLAGLVGGQQVPVGMTITYSGFQLSGGVGAPDFTNALANLGENPYEYVALPYTDST
ncbi:MAG: hypothetical protein J2P55_02275, partial [Rhizobiales bacterium]|nr:hypothetical protein [Hyphomicrobiales bacterium]